MTPPEAVESVRMLLAAGAKPEPNVIEPELSNANLDAHLLVARGRRSEHAQLRGAAALLLDIHEPPQAELLAKHGADFTALETTRDDRAGYTAAMNAAEMSEWEIVRFMLVHGVNARHAAPDGSTLRRILQRKLDEGAPRDTRSALLRMTQ